MLAFGLLGLNLRNIGSYLALFFRSGALKLGDDVSHGQIDELRHALLRQFERNVLIEEFITYPYFY